MKKKQPEQPNVNDPTAAAKLDEVDHLRMQNIALRIANIEAMHAAATEERKQFGMALLAKYSPGATTLNVDADGTIKR